MELSSWDAEPAFSILSTGVILSPVATVSWECEADMSTTVSKTQDGDGSEDDEEENAREEWTKKRNGGLRLHPMEKSWGSNDRSGQHKRGIEAL